MTKTRGQWIRFLLAGLSVAAAPVGLRAARAQGFGPDPFRPYNSQYEGYVRPLTPLGGPPGIDGRGMDRGDNQYQQYLRQLEGEYRASSERYGIEAPYWRARSDPDRDRRELKARRATRRPAEATLESINQKYLAYFSENDPRKRAILLREFSSIYRGGAGDAAARREDDPDDRDAAAELNSPRRLQPRAGAGADGRSPARTSRGRSDENERTGSALSPRRPLGASAESRLDTIPPAPPPRGLSRVPTRRARRPSETLRRSLEDDASDPGAPPAIRRPRAARPGPASPDE